MIVLARTNTPAIKMIKNRKNFSFEVPSLVDKELNDECKPTLKKRKKEKKNRLLL